MRLMSISRVGRASRITIIGTSVCPPAMTRAPSSAASIAQASSMSAAREYSNGAAFTLDADLPREPRLLPGAASPLCRRLRSDFVDALIDMVKVSLA